jgi:two-component system sensor histidine kinase SenX3
VLNALPLGVVLAAGDGSVIFRNRVAVSVVGLRHVDLLVEAAVDRLIRQTFDTAEAKTERLELFGPPPRVLIVSTVELADGFCLAVIEDISERSRIDSVRTDFVANISHELKTPVGALSILAETLQGEADPAVIAHLSSQMIKEDRVGCTTASEQHRPWGIGSRGGRTSRENGCRGWSDHRNRRSRGSVRRDR